MQHRVGTPVIPLRDTGARTARPPALTDGGNAVPAPRARPAPRPVEDLSDLEIPTFIRRQMD
jgi:hypothetical protein